MQIRFTQFSSSLLIPILVVFLTQVSLAQMPGSGGSLGGFGAMAGGSGSGTGGVLLAPFGGRFAVAVPATMASRGPLAYQPRSAATMNGRRPAFTISPMGGQTADGPGSMRRPFQLSGLGAVSGLGQLGTGRRPMSATQRAGVMPPNFGSPFRQPPSLLTPTTSGAGMPM